MKSRYIWSNNTVILTVDGSFHSEEFLIAEHNSRMRASRKSSQQLFTSLNPYDHIFESQVVKVLELVGLELGVLCDD